MGHNLKFLIITIIAISLTDALAARTYSRRVVLGDERFEEYQPLLQGKRVAVFSNQNGYSRRQGDRLQVGRRSC